ncbi:hypothetical protein E2C01_075293 [Portunus trituberculatus]|uniref:Uncharacterized protein n=1 Tax=Portunus trituberculatus TaxID=210409 RepID=A0A5B7IEQ5_PORTR|nr:hypothetical protein [Portunus trituberculatus]
MYGPDAPLGRLNGLARFLLSRLPRASLDGIRYPGDVRATAPLMPVKKSVPLTNLLKEGPLSTPKRRPRCTAPPIIISNYHHW